MAAAVASVDHLETIPPKTINLDLGEQRRHSFLPENWAEEKQETAVKNIGILEVNEDDDLFMYMQSSRLYQEKPMHKYFTGSKYLGQWNKLGIAGKGVYKYPHGVIYDGFFNRNGQFHGTGILVYPNGHRIEGIWKNGKLGADCSFIAAAGVVMNKNYCMMPDRRFQIEFENDFGPVGHEYLTDEPPPPRQIPKGCYDMVEGYFDPKIKAVIDYPKEVATRQTPSSTDPVQSKGKRVSTKFLFSGDERRSNAFQELCKSVESENNLSLMKERTCEAKKIISWIPSQAQAEWIAKSCRREWDQSVGYRPDLYEEWTKGGKAYMPTVDGDEEADSKCQLRTLNLHKKTFNESSDKRFLSFVVNKKDDKECATIEMLTKMFMKKTPMRSNLDLKVFSMTHPIDFISDDVVFSETAQ